LQVVLFGKIFNPTLTVAKAIFAVPFVLADFPDALFSAKIYPLFYFVIITSASPGEEIIFVCLNSCLSTLTFGLEVVYGNNTAENIIR
jgi:hypothetical protein